MAFAKTGQGASEYLVLMGAVLIIALVAIAILTFMPGTAPDARISQSAAYWRSEAKPIAVVEHQLSSNGSMYLVLQNIEAVGTIIVTNVSVANVTTSQSLKIGPGETRTVYVSGVEQDLPGTIYDFSLNFTYISPSGLSARQYGLKTLMGKRI